MITEADLAAAWASGYWHGTSHEGPLNDAAVAAKNPYRAKPGTASPEASSAATETEQSNDAAGQD